MKYLLPLKSKQIHLVLCLFINDLDNHNHVITHLEPDILECEVKGALGNFGASLVAQRLKCLPAMWETWVRSLGQEDPLGKEMATHSSILAWKTP